MTALLAANPYQGYVYAYPHKTAYRPLDPRPRLTDVWAAEPRDALFLYLHVPFCVMRCGFCNLFTRAGAPKGLTAAYLDALDRQAKAVRDALAHGPEEGRFALAAFGGGTPTYLTAAQLTRLCDIAGRLADLAAIPLSVETSPATATTDRLTVLAERGATRISIGVQSFLDTEARAAVRTQKRAEVEAALERIRAIGFPLLNIDLIYGIDGQTPDSWLRSLNAALAWRPEELYLYPLYVRPLTGLGRRGSRPDQRLTLYRIGRDLLLAHGYEQVSMRMFRLPVAGPQVAADYHCQSDGMVGLGCGARSYTADLHYSFEYAVGVGQVRGIIDDYVAERDFGVARVGFVLDEQERRRRHLIQSLLQASGLDRASYLLRFGTDAATDFAGELRAFTEAGWVTIDAGAIRLTAEGLAHSDLIGPALFSPRVRALMDAYEPR